MQIEKITKLKNGLYNITVMDENTLHQFKLNEDLLLKNNFYKNKMLTETEFEKLNQLTNESKLYTAALNYITYRMRSENEVNKYLIEKNNDELLIKQIIDKLKRLNYINDAIYSDAYTKHQFEINKKGPNLIKKELLKKQVDLKYINTSLDKLKTEMIEEKIQRLIPYYDKMNKKKSIIKLKETILRNLVNKGYDYQMVVMQLNMYNFLKYNDELAILTENLTKVYHKLVKKYQGHELKSRIIKTLLNKGFNYDDILHALDLFPMEG